MTGEKPQRSATARWWVQKKNNLDVIRFFLASSVIFGHSFQILLPEKMQILVDPTRRFAKGQMYIGDFAVDMFFVISGYLILMSWQRHPHWADYLRNRVLRIVPGYLLAFILSVAVFGVLGAGSFSAYLESIQAYGVLHWLREMVLIHPPLELATYSGSHLSQVLNAPMWTLNQEFRCYVGLLLLGLAGMLRGRWAVPILALGCLGYFVQSPIWDNPARLPLAFLVGMLFYQERELIQLKPTIAIVLPLLWWLAIQLGYALPFSALTCGYTALYLGLMTKPVKWLKPDFSYGMYLYGFPVQQVIAHWSGYRMDPIALSACAVVVAFVFAALSWFGVEERFMKLKARTGMREALTSAPS